MLDLLTTNSKRDSRILLSIGSRFRSWLVCLCLIPAVVATQHQASAGDAVTLYDSHGFEFDSGYDPAFLLAGQMDWIGQGTGGNGLVTNFFSGRGQQAFVGYFPPTTTEETLNVWRPLNLSPGKLRFPMVKFSVTMQIVDSTNNSYDDFRWSVYNTNGFRLFSLDFDNFAGVISYGLNDTNGFISTGFTFANDGSYDLEINMNFSSNTWSAFLNDTVIVNGKPISTSAANDLSLGDIDAVWALRDPKKPGDNFMVFDDYKITAESELALPVKLETLVHLPHQGFLLRLHGEPGRSYALESSEDFRFWRSIKTNTAPVPDGTFDYLDSRATNQPIRFYRARLLPL